MKLVYPGIFKPLEDIEGYCVEVPDLPGCVTEGDNLLHAIEMAVDAASGWILGELEDGNSIPSPSDPSTLTLDETGSFVTMLVLDMDQYAEKYGSKSVRKNITIPAWLNTYGEKQHINFSQVLQNAILELTQRK